MADIELESPPHDSISSVAFSPTSSDQLLVSSWDTTVRLYDVASKSEKARFDHKAAVLDCCFDADGKTAFSGGLDTWVRAFDLGTEKPTVVGTHEGEVACVVFARETGNLVTGSWDRTVKLWDPRGPSSDDRPPISSHEQSERVYAMDVVGSTLVVALAGRKFNIYDLRNMAAPRQERDSSLRYMTRAVACMANGEGYATSSIEGRISVEYFDPSPEAQSKKYAFKCHRQTIDGTDHVWPVNSLAFHPVYNTFASAGSDGTVSVWDHTAKKRLRQYPKFHSAVPAIAFSHDGTKLAVGVSYAWDMGEEGAKESGGKVSVIVKEVGDECKPKVKA